MGVILEIISQLRWDKSGGEVGFFLFEVDKKKAPPLRFLKLFGTDRQTAEAFSR